MKKTLLALGALMLLGSVSFGQVKNEKGLIQKIDEQEIPVSGTRYIFPTQFETYQFDIAKLEQLLANVTTIDDPNYLPTFLSLPISANEFVKFQVHINETMAPGLRASFPEIKALDGIAVDNSGITAKLDLTPQGFHAMIMIPGKSTVFIDPYSHLGDRNYYLLYDREHFSTNKSMECAFENELPTEVKDNGIVKSYGNCTKRTYRLALAATGEYTAFHGGTVALAQAAQVTTINRVNGVYMRDLAVTLTIIANNNLIIYTNASTDPYTNNNGGTMLGENQTNVNAVIGTANYDVGHVFSTGGGGVAALQSVCTITNKARGVTGSPAPVNDAFDIDYVAHELGHQFGGNHTFGANSGSCSGNGNPGTAMEPGSGTTIMAYAGICSPNDVQPHSDDHFHVANMSEIHTFLTGGANSCAVSTAIPNQSSPTVTVNTASFSVPISTPFALTATATDPDGDALTYCWEQVNAGTVNTPVATQTAGANFRSYTPSTSGTRYFPSIANQLAGTTTWEVLPSVSRTMSFRCLVRDNELGGGCNDFGNVTVTSVAGAGPFIVNYPTNTGITWPGNSTQTVTWSVANTTAAPISCANVDVLISTNGGSTFTVIANNVPNDGSQDITVPNTATTTAIVMVMCENGTFFDVSNNVFTITAATNDYTLALASNSISACQGTNAVYTVQVGQIGSYNSPVTLSATGIPAPATVNFSPNPSTPGSSVTMTVSNTGGVTPGSYNFTINGTSASGPHSVSGTLGISNTTLVASTLSTPVNNEPSAPLSPTLTWSNSGSGLTYDVAIATDNAFTNIVESASGLSSPTYTATLLTPATTYYWRVSTANGCAAAVNSTVFAFTTASCGVYNYSGSPVIISASGTPTVTATINIATGGTINDLNVVNLAGTHSYIGDLRFTLTSPSGTSVQLFNQICTNNADFDLELDDEATPGAIPCPPTTGLAYVPSAALTAFDGQPMNGTWTLTVKDLANADGGALNTWGLNICFTPSTPCNNPSAPTLAGDVAICAGETTTLSVTAGNLNDATNWQWYSGSCGGTNVGSGTSINVSAPGTYFVRGEGGCVTAGTCQSITVTQTTINAVASLSGVNLSATPNGATYQWINCATNAVVSTAQNFTATANGQYAVIATSNGCSDTSACVAVTTVGLEDAANWVTGLYPNPTTGLLTIQLDPTATIETMTVTDVTGRLVRVLTPKAEASVTLDMTSEAKGVYFLNTIVSGSIQTLRFIKE